MLIKHFRNSLEVLTKMPDLTLDLGCGNNKHPGSIGVDMNSGLDGKVDVIYEFERKKDLPFRDNTFSGIYMFDFVEHFQDIPWLMSEVHRVAQKDAWVEIRFPHYSSVDAHSDVTHCHRGFALNAFDHFDPSKEMGIKYSYYTLHGRYFPYKIENVGPEPSNVLRGRLRNKLFNLIGPDFYEKYVSTFIPLSNINLRLRVIK